MVTFNCGIFNIPESFCTVTYNCGIFNINFSESFWSGNFQLWHILGWRPSSADSWHHWPIRLPRKMSSFNALVKIKMNTITNTNTQTKINTNTNTTTKTSETIGNSGFQERCHHSMHGPQARLLASGAQAV